jgi:hypothetical protein
MARRSVHRDMVEFAQKKGWSTSMAAQQFGFSREAVQHACEKFYIYLDGEPPKTKRFSVSAASVDKYFADLARKKTQQAKGTEA